VTGPTYDPARLAAEVTVLLHAHGIDTTTGKGPAAIKAAEALLTALGVEPVDQHLAITYRALLTSVPHVRQAAVAPTEEDAETIARPWRRLPSTVDHRTTVTVLPVATAKPLAGAA
jgi:hypothetical protein